jgi:hypothetical protein
MVDPQMKEGRPEGYRPFHRYRNVAAFLQDLQGDRSFDIVVVRQRNQSAQAQPVLLRDRDKIFGATFREQVKGIKIEEVLSAPRSP